MTAYTLVVAMDKMEDLPKEREVDLILQTVVSDEYIMCFECGIDYYQYLEKAKRENAVHMVALKAIYALQAKTPFEQAIPPITRIISMEKTRDEVMYSLDVYQTEPWIAMGHELGHIDIWDYGIQKLIGSVQTGDESPVYTIKFIERKQWFIAGSINGFIHVYNCKTEVQKITSFCPDECGFPVTSLAVHPTHTYVLSACGGYIQLWDWDKKWECIQTFEEQPCTVYQLTFNPNDTNCFASASSNDTVKLWSIDSLKPKYTLHGHSDCVKCLHFFTRDDQQYLITGSSDKTAKIWDMQTKKCIYTLEGFASSVISVLLHPNIPLLITGSVDGAIHLWSATNFRLMRIFKIGSCRGARGLACLAGSRRVVIGHYSTLSIMEIHDEEPVGS